MDLREAGILFYLAASSATIAEALCAMRRRRRLDTRINIVSALGLFFEPMVYCADASSKNDYPALKQSPNLR
jgi:hypothetical protein